jgi:hypothetical protein
MYYASCCWLVLIQAILSFYLSFYLSFSPRYASVMDENERLSRKLVHVEDIFVTGTGGGEPPPPPRRSGGMGSRHGGGGGDEGGGDGAGRSDLIRRLQSKLQASTRENRHLQQRIRLLEDPQGGKGGGLPGGSAGGGGGDAYGGGNDGFSDDMLQIRANNQRLARQVAALQNREANLLSALQVYQQSSGSSGT